MIQKICVACTTNICRKDYMLCSFCACIAHIHTMRKRPRLVTHTREIIRGARNIYAPKNIYCCFYRIIICEWSKTRRSGSASIFISENARIVWTIYKSWKIVFTINFVDARVRRAQSISLGAHEIDMGPRTQNKNKLKEERFGTRSSFNLFRID